MLQILCIMLCSCILNHTDSSPHIKHNRMSTSSSLPESYSGLQRKKIVSNFIKLSSILAVGGLLPDKVEAMSSQKVVNEQLSSRLVGGIEKSPLTSKDGSSSSTFVNGLISGAATRVTKEVLLHPLDTIRVRLQSPNSSVPLFSNLYDGVGPALLSGVPAGAIFFAVKDYSKKELRMTGLGKRASTCAAVALANIPYWLVRCPAETLKTRQQSRSKEGDPGALSIVEQLRADGAVPVLADLYGSYSSNFIYALPADVIKFLACVWTKGL